MDALDLGILREMFRERVLFWGTLDPRISTDDIARRLGVAGSTVRSRLVAWQARGFLRGYEVMPNPSLFGATLATANFRVDDPRDKPRVAEDLALLEGTVTVADHVGPWMVTDFVSDDEAARERRLRLLRRLPGVAEVLPCVPLRLPSPREVLSPLDWRLVAGLRAEPGRPLARLARDLGVGPKTVARRYRALVDSSAVWFVPIVDFGRWDGGAVALLNLMLDADADPRAVAAAARTLPGAPLLLTSSADVSPALDEHAVAVLLHVEAVGAAEAAQCEALGIPGVAEVELLFPRGFTPHGAWSDPLVRRALAEAESARARRPARPYSGRT